MYELKAETEQECNNWVQAIDAARYVCLSFLEFSLSLSSRVASSAL